MDMQMCKQNQQGYSQLNGKNFDRIEKKYLVRFLDELELRTGILRRTIFKNKPIRCERFNEIEIVTNFIVDTSFYFRFIALYLNNFSVEAFTPSSRLKFMEEMVLNCQIH